MDSDPLFDDLVPGTGQVKVCRSCGCVYAGNTECPLLEIAFDKHWVLNLDTDEYERIS